MECVMENDYKSWRKTLGGLLHILCLLTAALGIAHAGELLIGQAPDQAMTDNILSRFNAGFWYSTVQYVVVTLVLLALAYWVDRKSDTD